MNRVILVREMRLSPAYSMSTVKAPEKLANSVNTGHTADGPAETMKMSAKIYLLYKSYNFTDI